MEALHLSGHPCVVFSLVVDGDGSVTLGSVVLHHLGDLFLEVNVSNYHPVEVKDFLSSSSSTTVNHSQVYSYSNRFLLMLCAVFLSLYFFFFLAETLISLRPFCITRVLLRLPTLAIGHSFRFLGPLLSNSIPS